MPPFRCVDPDHSCTTESGKLLKSAKRAYVYPDESVTWELKPTMVLLAAVQAEDKKTRNPEEKKSPLSPDDQLRRETGGYELFLDDLGIPYARLSWACLRGLSRPLTGHSATDQAEAEQGG